MIVDAVGAVAVVGAGVVVGAAAVGTVVVVGTVEVVGGGVAAAAAAEPAEPACVTAAHSIRRDLEAWHSLDVRSGDPMCFVTTRCWGEKRSCLANVCVGHSIRPW